MKNPAKQYQESRILTAPKEELLLMLLEGGVRFAEQGRALLEEKKFEESCQRFIRSQRIVIELIASLDEKLIESQLYANLVSLYYFVYWRFVRASVNRDLRMADEGLRILRSLRETWAEAVVKGRKDGLPAPPVGQPVPRPQGGGLDLSS